MGRERRARSKGSLKRSVGTRGGRRVLIVCEGSDTEPLYFRALRDELKLGAVHVHVEGEECGSAPISVVEHALQLKRRPPDGLHYDAIWCVIDRDAHKSFDRAVDQARANDICLAVSVRQFEFWYLLHFVYTTRPWPDGETLLRALAEHLPGYDKNCDVATVLQPLRPVALARAERIRAHNREVHDEPYPNPMTDVDRLVCFLVDLKP